MITKCQKDIKLTSDYTGPVVIKKKVQTFQKEWIKLILGGKTLEKS